MTESSTKPIAIEIRRETTCFIRVTCDVCGSYLKNLFIGEPSPGTSPKIFICECCLEAGDIDARLLGRADALESWAAETKALVGRIKVPNFAEWRANDELEREAAGVKEPWMEDEADAIDNEARRAELNARLRDALANDEDLEKTIAKDVAKALASEDLNMKRAAVSALISRNGGISF